MTTFAVVAVNVMEVLVFVVVSVLVVVVTFVVNVLVVIVVVVNLLVFVVVIVLLPQPSRSIPSKTPPTLAFRSPASSGLVCDGRGHVVMFPALLPCDSENCSSDTAKFRMTGRSVV